MPVLHQVYIAFTGSIRHSGAHIKRVSQPYLPNEVRVSPNATSNHREFKDSWVYDGVAVIGSNKADVEDHAAYLRGVLLR